MIESVDRFLKTYPSQTINIILKDSSFFSNHIDHNKIDKFFLTGNASLLTVSSNDVKKIETIYDLSVLYSENLSVSATSSQLKTPQEIKQVPNPISKRTQNHHTEKLSDIKQKRLLKQPITGRELTKKQASHSARIHVLQDIQLNRSTSTWEMFNDIKQDEIKELEDDNLWMQPEKVSALYHQNSSGYYGEFEHILQPGELYPLPSYQTTAHLQGVSISDCNPDKLKKAVNNDTGQILIGLKPEIKLPHRVKATFTSVSAPLSLSSASKARCLQLPPNLRKWLENAQQKLKTSDQQKLSLPSALGPFVTLIRQVNETKDDLQKKLSLIRHYCHQSQAKTKVVNYVKDIEDFITQCLPADIEQSEKLALETPAILCCSKYKIVICKYFQPLFYVDFLASPLRMIVNDEHALLEAPQFFNDGKPPIWQTYELGGVEPDCEYEIEELSAPKAKVEVNDLKSNPLTRTACNELRQDYDDDQNAHPPIQELTDLTKKIADNNDPVRIVLPTEDAMYTLARNLRSEGQSLFIIRELTELIAAQTSALNGKSA